MVSTHTHHQFGEDVPCDLPDTYEAHYGPKGGITPRIADKAKRLVEEDAVIRVRGHVYRVEGDTDTYTVMVGYARDGSGACTCPSARICSHVMAACAFELANPYHPLAADFDPFEGIGN